MIRIGRSLAVLCVMSIFAAAYAQDAKEEDKYARDEAMILEPTNKARAKENLPPLKSNATLTKAARDHSANMSKQMKQAHVLDNKNPTQRVNAAGYLHLVVAENIGWVYDLKIVPKMFEEGWMKSPGHRANILGKFEEIGIGLVPGKAEAGTQDAGKDGFYITQVFSTQRKKK